MRSIPIVVITGQVPTHLIGNDAFQECDTVGITRPCTKYNFLVKDVNELAERLHESFHIAQSGRPGPVLLDVPKDVLLSKGIYKSPDECAFKHKGYRPQYDGDPSAIKAAVQLMLEAKRPVFYTGGGVINSGPLASKLLRELVRQTGYPITSTLMGLGAYPADDKQWLGMLGMHGTLEANLAMHDCDVMICIGARFDDRITGKLSSFSPNSRKIHVDIDPSSINKNVRIGIPIVGDCAKVLEAMLKEWHARERNGDLAALRHWWKEIAQWRSKKSLSYSTGGEAIMPQYAIERLYELTKDRDVYITTEVGQHQMWTAQHYGFKEPNRLMTSGGLGTMGYGLPASMGVQLAHPDSLVICIAGDGSLQMNIQEFATIVEHRLPIKVIVLNNKFLGMVRQWQDLFHGQRYSSTPMYAPDFVKLAEAYGATGLRCARPEELDGAIKTMLETQGPVLLDCSVAQLENCFPMIPAGAAHNEVLLGSASEEMSQ